MQQYNCYDLVLLQDLSSKLQRLGYEPLQGEFGSRFSWRGCVSMVLHILLSI